jgi:RHS repeat-associated protein
VSRIAVRIFAWLGLLLGSAWWVSLGGGCTSSPPSVPGPLAGIPEFQELGLLPVPGAQLQVAGGNLIVARTDLEIDTWLGPIEVGQVWNAATKQWLSSFSPSYTSGVVTDPTGAAFSIGSQANGTAIPGTTWVKLDAQTLRTKGGLVYAFDTGGRLTTVRWASSSYPRLAYVWQTIAGAQRLARIDQCTIASSCGVVYTLSYDAAGRLVSIVDRAGRSALYAYDAGGRLASARDGLDVARGWPGFRYEYDAAGRLVALTNSEGERSEYAYDGGGRLSLARAVGAGNPTSTFTYKAVSGVFETTDTDPTNRVTRYRWNGNRAVTQIQNGAGEITSWQWSGKRPIRRTEPDGVGTTWTWLDDDVATETQPSGNVLSFSYAPNAVDREQPSRRPLASLSDSLGVREQRTYDGSGRLITVTNGAGESVGLTYATNQTLYRVDHPAGESVLLEAYGAHGHPTEVTKGGVLDTRIYDAAGNLLEGDVFGQPAGAGNPGVVSRSFDEDRNLASVTVAGFDYFSGSAPQGTITLTSRSDHRRLSITRPHGGDSVFVYDVLGRFVERRDRSDGTFRATVVARDAAGRRLSRELPNGMRESMNYDPAGRVQSLSYHRGTTLEVSAQLAFSAGRLVSQTDSSYGAPESYEWDAAGRVERVVFPGGESADLSYDLRGRNVGETLRRPDGSILLVLDFEYDGADRLAAIREGAQTLLERAYDNGLLDWERYGNGLVRDLTWVGTRLTGAVMRNAQGVVVESTEVSQGLCVEIYASTACATIDTITSVGVSATTREAYEPYSQIPNTNRSRRLARWGSELFETTPGEYWIYTHDELGNLTRVEDGVTTRDFVYNGERNRLLSVQGPSGTLMDYTWDAAGFATSRGGVPLSWTAQERIAAIGAIASFGWDAVGRPRYVSALGSARHYRFGGRVYGPTSGVFGVADYGPFALDLVGSEDRYRHNDFRGNVKLVTDETGAVVTHYRYSGYGVEEVRGAPGDGTSFAHGRELSGLLLLGRRVLDPVAGRFLSPDPIYQIVNQFAYADGNPVEFWDPGGDFLFSCSGEIEVKIDATVKGKGVEASGRLAGSISGDSKEGASEGAESESGSDSSSADGSSGGSGGDTGGGGGGGGGTGGSGSGCSPDALTRVPRIERWLAILIPTQLVLGALLLARRRTGN